MALLLPLILLASSAYARTVFSVSIARLTLSRLSVTLIDARLYLSMVLTKDSALVFVYPPLTL